VLITVPSLAREFGGPVAKAAALAEALRERGHVVRVAGAGSAGEPGSIGLGRIGGFHGTPVPASFAPLRRAVAGADVVHVIGYRDPVGTVAAFHARRRRVPFVFEPVGMMRPRVRSFALKLWFDSTIGRLVRDGTGALIVTSSVERDDLERGSVDRLRVRVRPNGVSFDGLWPLPDRGPLRARLGIAADVPLVVTLARLAAIKQLPTLVRAVAAAPPLHVLIAGPDEGDGTLASLREAARDPAVRGRIHVISGGLWGDDKASALAEADAFCLASDYESFGNAAAEAAGVGAPVVITHRCGVIDLLPGAHVVEAEDPLALGAALQEAIGDKDRASSQAAEVRERLSWATMAARQEAIYEEVS